VSLGGWFWRFEVRRAHQVPARFVHLSLRWSLIPQAAWERRRIRYPDWRACDFPDDAVAASHGANETSCASACLAPAGCYPFYKLDERVSVVMPKLDVIEGTGGRERRHNQFWELMMRFGITGDQSYLDQANEMAKHEGEIANRRASITVR